MTMTTTKAETATEATETETTAEATTEAVAEKKLRRGLSPVGVWAMAFGCIIGWGSFLMPGNTFLKRAGPLGSLFALEMGAFVMLIISYCYFYMLQKYPDASSPFIYAKRAFGKVHGFICAWFLVFCYICIIPLNATALQPLMRTIANSTFQFGFQYIVAGYEVYLGEILLALGALLVFALICMLDIRTVGWIQLMFAVIQVGGVVVMSIGAVLNPGKVLHEDLGPLFHPQSEANILFQMLSILAIAPWAFVGFEVAPQLSHESNFSADRTKVIMDTSIVSAAAFYIALTLMAALAIPVGYTTWVEYIYGLPYLRGMASIPTAFAAHRLMGATGTVLWTAAALSAAFSSIIGFYIVTSRLICNMAQDGMIPPWFGHLTRRGVPVNATLFCMAVSMVAPFFGRTVLSWAVDMSSIGGTICFAYTSLAAWQHARKEKRTDIMAFSFMGFVFSVLFAALLLIPIPVLDCAIGKESWSILTLWTALGGSFLWLARIQRTALDEEALLNEVDSFQNKTL